MRTYIIKNCNGDKYLTRRFLLEFPFGKLMLHTIHRSDEDRELHDHPWNFLTLILKGGYTEVTPTGQKHYRPGTILWRPAKFSHRLIITPGKEAVTLVWRGRRLREWGFFASGGWKHWKHFLTAKGCGEQEPSTVD